MAFGDKNKMQNAADYEKNLLQNHIDNQRDVLVGQNQNFWNQYLTASGEAQNDYRSIMDQFKNFQATTPDRISAQNVSYNRSPEMAAALAGYQDFANTGGFSGDDIANMRARGISPIRAVYANMQNELIRQRALQGGYSPNYAAAVAKMANSRSGQIADAAQNVEATLAQMRQQGRQFGLSGLGNLSVEDTRFGQNAQLANQDAALRAGMFNAQTVDPMRLAAIQGQANLFGQTPGMASMYANNLLNSNNQWSNVNNQQMGKAGLALNAQQATAATPSNFQTGLGYAGQIGGMAASIAAPFMTGGASSLIPSSRVPGASGTYSSYPSAGPSQGSYTPTNWYGNYQRGY